MSSAAEPARPGRGFGSDNHAGVHPEILAAIAAAVEEQDAATQEIARNVEQAARGTQQVSGNIAGVTAAAGETGSAASQVLQAARLMAERSHDMRNAVDGFLAGVRAA